MKESSGEDKAALHSFKSHFTPPVPTWVRNKRSFAGIIRGFYDGCNVLCCSPRPAFSHRAELLLGNEP